MGRLAPDRLSALRHVATIESAGSSTRIEGAKLTDREVERLLSNLEIKSLATGDEQEVAGYAETMELVFKSFDVIRTENPDWQPWLLYFLQALKQQKDRLEKKIERERVFLGDLPELSVQILEL